MSSTRIRYMDYLNVVACFSVVLLHCSLMVFTPTVSFEWSLSLLFQSIFIFAVPVFFMLSGANLLNYRERYDTKTFFSKRLKRTFFALLLASIIYYSLSCFCPSFFALPPRHFSVLDFVQSFLKNDICSIYWFFYSILMLYLITPILSFVAPHRKLMQYCLVLGFIAAIVVPDLNRYFHLDEYTAYIINLPMFTESLFYYMLGYYLTHHLKHRVPVAALIVVMVLAIGATFAIGFHMNNGGIGSNPADVAHGAKPKYNSSPVSISTISCVFLSASVFLLFAKLEPHLQGHDRLYKAILLLSDASLGIYAMHFIFLYQVSMLGLHRIRWDLFARPIVVYVITAVVVIIARFIWKRLRGRLKRAPAHAG